MAFSLISRRSGQNLLSTVVVSVAALPAWLLSRQSGFFADDNHNLWMAHALGRWHRSYILESNFGHMAIGHRAINFIAFGQGHASWSIAQALIVGLALTCSYLGLRLGRVIGDSERCGHWSAVIMGSSVLWFTSWAWWASASDVLFTLPACLLGLEFAWRRLMTGHRGWSVACAACTLLALASRERPAILPAYLLLLALATSPFSLGDRHRVLKRLRQTADLWVASGLSVTFYLLFLFRHGFLAGQLPGQGNELTPSSPLAAAYFIGVGLTQGLVPSLFGISPAELAVRSPWLMTVSQVALLGLAIPTIGLIERAWRAWALAFAAACLSLLPLAVGRGGDLGYAVQGRFLVDCLPFVCVSFSMVWRSARNQGNLPVNLLGWAQIPVALTILGGTLLSYQDYCLHGAFIPYMHQSRTFRQTLKNLNLAPDETLVDGPVPNLLLVGDRDSNRGYATALSNYLPVFKSNLTFLDPTARTLVEFDFYQATLNRYQVLAREEVPLSKLQPIAPKDLPLANERRQQAMEIPCAGGWGDATMVSIRWHADGPLWAHPIAIDAAHAITDMISVPANLSKNSSSFIYDRRAGELGCGVRLPENGLQKIQAVAVTYLKRLQAPEALPHMPK